MQNQMDTVACFFDQGLPGAQPLEDCRVIDIDLRLEQYMLHVHTFFKSRTSKCYQHINSKHLLVTDLQISKKAARNTTLRNPSLLSFLNASSTPSVSHFLSFPFLSFPFLLFPFLCSLLISS